MHVREREALNNAIKRYLNGEKFTHVDLRILVNKLFESEQEVIEQLRELEQEFEELFKQKSAIPWKDYDPTDRSIVSHVDHLVTNGHRTLIAQHASIPGTSKYSWMINNVLIAWVTHYAEINLPDDKEAEA